MGGGATSLNQIWRPASCLCAQRRRDKTAKVSRDEDDNVDNGGSALLMFCALQL